ncbi:AAA family ATPase [Candidatus Woesearchaeota archaeon]|nr:AAA family ATPase [Candidatus Woesearchaeota archaeon]
MSKEKKGLSLTWYEKNDFDTNPLNIKPKEDQEIIGHEEKIRVFEEGLDQKSIWVVYGGFGCGKTTLMKRLIKKYAGKHKLIYVSHNRVDGSMNTKKILQKRMGKIKRLLRIMPKHSVLFIDEAAELDIKEVRELLYYYEKENLKNIIIINPSFFEHPVFEELKKIVGDNYLDMNALSLENAVDILKTRLLGADLISLSAIKQLYLLSDGNPRRFLEFAEHAIRIAHEIGDGRANTRHVTLLRGVLRKN